MRFRPCIDIHNGRVKQIIGGSLKDKNDFAKENFVSEMSAAHYAKLYKKMNLTGGHVIMLNPKSSEHYEKTKEQALLATAAWPNALQVGGGITPDNAYCFLDAGASHVIVTSYVFKNGMLDEDNLKKIMNAVGRERLVLDLSCRKKAGDYYIVTDRWQKFTDIKLTGKLLEKLSPYCDEFLVHAADAEGKAAGIEEDVVGILASLDDFPVTYAGGVGSLEDIEKLKKIGKGKVDVTVGSALDMFGGWLPLEDVLNICRYQL